MTERSMHAQTRMNDLQSDAYICYTSPRQYTPTHSFQYLREFFHTMRTVSANFMIPPRAICSLLTTIDSSPPNISSLLSFFFMLTFTTFFLFFFFNNPAPPEIYPLPLHAALPI